MLEDKLKFMTTSLAKQIRDQAEHANEVDVESKKLLMELNRQKEEQDLKQSELNKLDSINADFKQQKYDYQINEMERKQFNYEK